MKHNIPVTLKDVKEWMMFEKRPSSFEVLEQVFWDLMAAAWKGSEQGKEGSEQPAGEEQKVSSPLSAHVLHLGARLCPLYNICP